MVRKKYEKEIQKYEFLDVETHLFVEINPLISSLQLNSGQKSPGKL